MEFVTTLKRKRSSLLWNFQIEVPTDISEHFMKDNNRRVICTLNKIHSFHAALMPDGKGDFFITINSEIRKKLNLDKAAELQVALQVDNSKYGIYLPPEMEELLLVDEEGSRLFHLLTPGKQRSLMHIIGKPKNSDIRLKKAVAVLEHLKSNNGKLDFKMLNEAFKERNRY